MNLEDASPAEGAVAYTAIVWSRRARESARPIVVVCDGDILPSLLEQNGLERRVLVERTLEDALRFVVATHWLKAFAEFGADVSARP